ncbi:MAG: hypothetical protein J6Y03_00415 [Alphaproteobacteria bacterium]|nr:hypothetical protein [Alphaproteobacteria bacterium]
MVQIKFERSTIKVICILAIIGALSYTCVALYSSKVNSEKANEILNEAFGRAADISKTFGNGETPDIKNFGQKEGWSLQLATPRQEQFTLTINAVNKNVCSLIVGKAEGTTVRKVISADKNVTKNAGDCSSAALSLIFNNDLSMHKYPERPCSYFEKEDEDKCVLDTKKFEKFKCPVCFKECNEIAQDGIACASECIEEDCCIGNTAKKKTANKYEVICYYS